MSINSVMSNYSSGTANDIRTAVSAGTDANNAHQNLISAIDSGDEDKIAKAQIENDKAQEKYSALMATLKQKHDMIMQMIQNLAR